MIIEKTIGNRVAAKAEIEGLDIPEMGVLGYVNEDTRRRPARRRGAPLDPRAGRSLQGQRQSPSHKVPAGRVLTRPSQSRHADRTAVSTPPAGRHGRPALSPRKPRPGSRSPARRPGPRLDSSAENRPTRMLARSLSRGCPVLDRCAPAMDRSAATIADDRATTRIRRKFVKLIDQAFTSERSVDLRRSASNGRSMHLALGLLFILPWSRVQGIKFTKFIEFP